MGVNRRSFIKFLVGGAAGTLVTPLPWKMADDISIWTQNWPWIPTVEKQGEPYVAPTICKSCSGVCALDVQMVGNNPITASGNAEHPLSNGGICPMGAASVRLLYSPARVPGPMKKTGDGFEPISWDEAQKLLSERLGKAGGNVALISGDSTGSATEVLGAFVRNLGSESIFLMPTEAQTASLAWNQVMGGQGQVGYDLENSDFVLMLGADIFESWGTSLRYRKIFASQKEKGNAQYVYVGPVENGTAAIADTWVPSFPSRQGVIALGIAFYLFQEGIVSVEGADMQNLRRFVMTNFSPKQVEKETGVSAAELGRMARGLIRAKRPLVIAGSEFGMGMGAFDYAAGLALNVMLGRVNKKGGLMVLPGLDPVVSGAPTSAELYQQDLLQYLDQVAKETVKRPDVLMVYEANPAYTLPHTDRMAKLIEQVPFRVSFSSFMDETAAMSDLILPSSLCLERMDDAYTPLGAGQAMYAVGQAVTEPAFDTKNIPDFILEMADAMGIDLGFGSFEEVLQAKAEAVGADFDELVEGAAWTGKQTAPVENLSMQSFQQGFSRKNGNGAYPVALAPMAKANIGTTKVATPGISLVTIRPVELKGKDFFVQVNGATAAKYDLAEGQRVRLVSPVGEVTALVHIFEGVMSDVVAAPLGFGHTAWDLYTQDKGDNVYKLMTVKPEPGTGSMVFADTRVKIIKI